MSTPDQAGNPSLVPPEGSAPLTPPGASTENAPMSINSFFYTVPTTEEGLAARQAAAANIMGSAETFADLPELMQNNIKLIGNDPHAVIDSRSGQPVSSPERAASPSSGAGGLGEAAMGTANETPEAKGSLEGLPEDAVPIFPGDEDITIDVAHIGWDPSSDITLLRTTEGVKLATSYPTDTPGVMVSKDHVFRAPEAGPATRYAIINGMPSITYTYDSVDAARVNTTQSGGPGRPNAGFMLFGKRGSKDLTARLALRLVDTDQEGLRIPGDDADENGIDPLKSEINQLKLDELKRYQKAQREEVYRLLDDQGARERLTRVLAAALQSPVYEGVRQRNLYMPDTSERVGHAILTALDDMLSATPEELQDAVGGDWTFATAVNPLDEFAGAHHENNVRLRFDFSVKRRTSGPPAQSAPAVPPLSSLGGEFTRAATRLVSTYLEGGAEDNAAAKQRVAGLVAEAGQFDPRNLRDWCERLAPAA